MHLRTSSPAASDSSPPAIEVGACTDVGQVRAENQDHYGLFPPEAPRLFVVADGMGGHEDGGTASRIAVAALGAHYAEADASAGGDVAQRLEAAMHAAASAVWAEANANGRRRTMGTTCTALAVEAERVVLAHVGDSRAYRVDDGGLVQLSPDHTVAAELMASGALTAAEAGRHPQRHALTRALGTRPHVELYVHDLGPARAGGCFVLCSDGLAPVGLGEVERVVSRYAPQEAAEWLVAQANALGGRDNITVVVVRLAEAR